jgi:hypothetical protein
MKVKVSLLVTAVGILSSIDLTKMKLSTSYKVRQVLTESQTAVQDFETQRVALAEELGTLNEDKTKYDFETDEIGAEFRKRLQVMMDDEIDIKVEKIPVEILDEYITIEPQNIPYVEWFISGLE